MAVTGIGLLGFVFAHMLGNLKIFIGEVEEDGVLVQDIDVYAEFLREIGEPLFPHGSVLWLMRLGLIAMFALHIHAAYTLNKLNNSSNVRYQQKTDWLASNFASRTMRYTGPIMLAYIIWHLADLTWGFTDALYSNDGAAGPATGEWHHGDVYANLHGSLGNPISAIIYIVANMALALHIFHGAWSMFQSLGINNPRYNAARRYFAAGFAGLIFVGNVSIVIATMADWV